MPADPTASLTLRKAGVWAIEPAMSATPAMPRRGAAGAGAARLTLRRTLRQAYTMAVQFVGPKMALVCAELALPLRPYAELS